MTEIDKHKTAAGARLPLTKKRIWKGKFMVVQRGNDALDGAPAGGSARAGPRPAGVETAQSSGSKSMVLSSLGKQKQAYEGAVAPGGVGKSRVKPGNRVMGPRECCWPVVARPGHMSKPHPALACFFFF